MRKTNKLFNISRKNKGLGRFGNCWLSHGKNSAKPSTLASPPHNAGKTSQLQFDQFCKRFWLRLGSWKNDELYRVENQIIIDRSRGELDHQKTSSAGPMAFLQHHKQAGFDRHYLRQLQSQHLVLAEKKKTCSPPSYRPTYCCTVLIIFLWAILSSMIDRWNYVHRNYT
jgi:hypothetical protein